ncbi:hypothetical protein P5673_027700 [Acropora cervicornis]|uniref:Uncharacterized protein n=1 Tax=Acropora cervicornis TaxID=6130 RepID=A0AAD9UVW0_ACRCE|nr:hypothetical protein P5673_027700 [Acropora cervicornis]
MKWFYIFLSVSTILHLAGGRPVAAGDCTQCMGSLPRCNLPGLFGLPKCTAGFEKCKFTNPRPFRPGILQMGQSDCF